MSKTDNPDKAFDLRTLEYELARGSISQKDYDKYLASIPDEEGNFEEVVIQDEPSEDAAEDVIEEGALAASEEL